MFDWFRRKFGDRAQEENAEQQQQEQAQPPEPETTQAESTETKEDYLKWAQAAYQNIQQRQAEQEQEVVESEPEESVAEEEPVTEEPVTEQVEPTVEEPVAEIPVTEEAELTQEEPVTEELETVAEESVTEQVEPEVEETVAEIPATEEIASTSEEPESTQGEPEPVIEEPVTEQVEPTVEETVTEIPVTEEAELTQEEPVTEELETVAEESVTEQVEPEVEEPVAEEIESTSEEPEPVVEESDTEEIESTPEEPVTQEEEAASETPATEEEPAPAPVPAWMQKSDALERLKATAIETEEPEPTTQKTEEPEVAFDEDFVWSAQVLASQGRQPDDVSVEEINWLKRLRQGLGKTRRGLINQLKSIVGQGPLNADAVMEIEALLLQADVGVEATDYIIETLQEKLREEALPPERAIAYLKKILKDLLDRPLENEDDPTFVPEKDILNIWLLTGVNGAGKTTTIGKLAHLAQKSGYTCLIAAADTFRAAAVEQVKVWGERSNTQVIANPGQNTDPAAVVFDAIAAAQSRNTELLLVDTAGRLQNKKNLMEELAKIRRIIDKKAPDTQVESLLVLDATLGQNGLRQAQVFSEAAKLSGVVLTKLDGTAKGGVALAVAQQLNLPIRFIGAGEGIEDLRPFSSYEFVEALLSE
ncbi:signal recognition particle-docking protein FtsY [Lusitaniella coriacea]|uniref:signal recognition particle-docking protein FtsY n=1 Tax=Lusitaniella coriacea TaxID=1983105 RepID=UPI002D21BC29|nr:signal recognition particle-docking protein FtsY [Lusitaniella coriacea]